MTLAISLSPMINLRRKRGKRVGGKHQKYRNREEVEGPLKIVIDKIGYQVLGPFALLNLFIACRLFAIASETFF